MTIAWTAEFAIVILGQRSILLIRTEAIRFSRRKDAEKIAECLENEDISITEHVWGDDNETALADMKRLAGLAALEQVKE
jgi:hypothetical protein